MKQDKSIYPQSLGKALNITDTKRLLISKGGTCFTVFENSHILNTYNLELRMTKNLKADFILTRNPVTSTSKGTVFDCTEDIILEVIKYIRDIERGEKK